MGVIFFLLIWLAVVVIPLTMGLKSTDLDEGAALLIALFFPYIALVMLIWRKAKRYGQHDQVQPIKEVRTPVPAATVSTRLDAPTLTRECPWCAETIKAAARLCRYCRSEVEPVEAHSS